MACKHETNELLDNGAKCKDYDKIAKSQVFEAKRLGGVEYCEHCSYPKQDYHLLILNIGQQKEQSSRIESN